MERLSGVGLTHAGRDVLHQFQDFSHVAPLRPDPAELGKLRPGGHTWPDKPFKRVVSLEGQKKKVEPNMI